jgi:hypothetical protein
MLDYAGMIALLAGCTLFAAWRDYRENNPRDAVALTVVGVIDLFAAAAVGLA